MISASEKEFEWFTFCECSVTILEACNVPLIVGTGGQSLDTFATIYSISEGSVDW